MQLPDRPAFQLLLGEPGHLLGHVVDAQDRPSLITDLKDRCRGVIERLAMALLLIAQGLFACLDKEVGDVQEPFVELLIEQGQQLDQLLPVLGVGLAQTFDHEEPDLHLSSEEAGGRPVSDEAVARVLVKVDVGVDVVRIFKKRLHNGIAFPTLFPYRLCFVVTIPLLRGPFSGSQRTSPYHFIFFSLLCMVTEVPCVQTGGKVAPGEGLKHPVLMGRERLDRARLLACPSVNEWSRKNGLRHTTIPTYSLCCASRRETWKRSSSSSTSTLRRWSTSPLIFSERGREPKRLPRRCFCRSTAGRSVMSPRPSSRPGCSRLSTTTV